MARPFFTYILQCADDSYYVGQTDDLDKRISEHGAGIKCKYTHTRRPIKLVWSAEFQTRDEAKQFETQVKKWRRSKKEALINRNFDLLKTLAKKDFTTYNNRTA